MSGEPVQCAVCGWTGQRTDLDGRARSGDCPACGESVADAS